MRFTRRLVCGVGCGAALMAALALSSTGCDEKRLPTRAAPRAWPLRPDGSSAEFEDEIRAFEAEDRKQPPARGQALFVGSSSIRLWQSLADDFKPHATKNRGFGGASIRNVIDFGRRMVLPYAPSRIVFFAGTNDIHAGASAQAVLADFQTFVAGVHETLPQTRIAFLSITTSPSRFAEIDTVRAANGLIRDYIASDPKLSYIDILSPMLDAAGRPRAELYIVDHLHPSRAGYALWIPRIEPFLRD